MKEIKPIGQFILDNSKGVNMHNGTYYHYADVCTLIKKYVRSLGIRQSIKEKTITIKSIPVITIQDLEEILKDNNI